MNEEYLWERRGEPDPEIVNLEELPAPLSYRPRPPIEIRRRSRPVKAWALAAAAVAIAAGCLWLAASRRPSHAAEPAWLIASSEGAPRVDSGAPVSNRLYPGQVIETDAHSRATIRSQFVGELTLAPKSRLSIEAATSERQVLALQHGSIHALIWAPPARFVVDTPSARATDLGCVYTLNVDPDGNGLLTVEAGWVALHSQGRESFIPEGAACQTARTHGLGVPYFLDATPECRSALASLGKGNALDIVLAQARPKDALSLWHLLSRVPREERGRVFDRFASLVHLPPVVRREGVIEGNRAMLDQAWDALDLGNTGWWRHWRRDW